MTEPEPRKSKRFKESVGHQVEDRRHVRANAERGDHKSKLRNGGICQHTFDIILRHGNGRGEDGGKRTDERHNGHGGGQRAPVPSQQRSAGRCGWTYTHPPKPSSLHGSWRRPGSDLPSHLAARHATGTALICQSCR